MSNRDSSDDDASPQPDSTPPAEVAADEYVSPSLPDEEDDEPSERDDGGELDGAQTSLADGGLDGAETSLEDGEFDGSDAVETRPASGRSKTGLWLFAAAGALWATFGIMRCDHDGPPVEPTAAVTPTDESPSPHPVPELDSAPPPTPAIPGQDEPEPEPAAELPDTQRDDVDVDPGGSAPEVGGLDPRPQPAAWARRLSTPDVVKYVVRRGGSIKNVANLYKIFHHEITSLNPGVTLEQDLPPKSAVVVYRSEDGARSASIGLPSSGKLTGGVPMMDGPGRVMKMIGWKSFGTANTVALLDAVLRRWAKTGHSQPVIVGNMSARSGGKLSPHSTHQSGRDVDLGYPQILPAGEELNWRVMDGRNLDAKETWALLAMLAQTGQVEVVYIDRSVQKLLHEYAMKTNLMSKKALSRWMEYPSPTGSGRPVIQHVKGHVDHLHVRFKCQPHESECRSRQR